MSDPAQPSRALIAVLTILTVVSGLVDAVSYLGLGHVFTANMTGNVVILGFAAAGSAGFSVPACLVSLGTFLTGAACTGRAEARLDRRRLMIMALAIEGTLTAGAAAIAFSASVISAGWPRFAIIALLGFGMGVRNAMIRKLGVADMTTTVLTMTLTGLAADAGTAGLKAPRVARRVTAVVAMLVGALVGALVFLHQGAGPALIIGAAIALGLGAVFGSSAQSRQLEPAKE